MFALAGLPFAIVVTLSVLATSFLSGIFGMAGGLILMGILLAIMPVAPAMALHGIVQMASNGWRALLWWRHIDWRIMLGSTVGNLLALALFVAIAWVPGKATAYIVLGIVPFLVRPIPDSHAPNITRPFMPLLCGTVVQALQLTCGVSGATLDIFYVRSGMDRRRIVATKAATQTVGHAIKLVYFGGILAAGGTEGLDPWLLGVAVGTAMLGATLARRALEALTDAQFIHWSQRLILAIGAVYLAQGLWLAMG